jgi:uncharacterized integral membrane protein
MNARLIAKLVLLVVVLLLLVLVGMHNKDTVAFALPPLITRPVKLPAALMYFAWFAIGLLTGALLIAGVGKSGSSSASRSSSKTK